MADRWLSDLVGTLSGSFNIGSALTLQPGNMTENVTITFPPDNGSANQALVTDGAGTTHWGAIATGGLDIVEANFTFETTSPVLLKEVVSGYRTKRAVIEITEAFDGGATLSIGHTGNAEALMLITQNIPTQVGVYETFLSHLYAGGDSIRLYITPGTATQGAGTAYVELDLG